MSNLDDRIAAVIKGDLEQYRSVIDEFEAKVRVVLVSMVPDPNMVDDLTQEVFVIAYQKLSAYKPGTRFDAWLRTIARNVAQNERRRWYRKQNLKERYRAEVGRKIEEDIDSLVASLRGNVVDALRSCVERLNQTAQNLVNGFYYKGHSVRELAGGYNMSEGSVRIALHRARRALAECLKGKGVVNNKGNES